MVIRDASGTTSIAFRPLATADLPLLHRWLNTPHVAAWWGEAGCSLEQVEEKYAPRTDGREPTRCYLILRDEEEIGFIQTYLIRDYPEYSAAI